MPPWGLLLQLFCTCKQSYAEHSVKSALLVQLQCLVSAQCQYTCNMAEFHKTSTNPCEFQDINDCSLISSLGAHLFHLLTKDPQQHNKGHYSFRRLACRDWAGTALESKTLYCGFSCNVTAKAYAVEPSHHFRLKEDNRVWVLNS